MEPGAAAFLAALARDRLPIEARVAIVVAHPDDETIGCGAQLPRFSNVTIIHVTDGAPRSLTDARARGFDTAESYAAARRRELAAAITIAGVPADRLVALGWPDQEAARHLRELVDDLTGRLAQCDVVLTHAYEGGHPDHDATAFAVHHAAARIGSHAPAIVEMPLYRAGPEGRLAQSFHPEQGLEETVIELGPDEVRLKEKMFAAHATQQSVLGWFNPAEERYRVAPRYDFSRLPNKGALLYEQFGWGMTGSDWLQSVRRFQGSA